jgi:FAD binding domain in molybdopterin dehydrogenase
MKPFRYERARNLASACASAKKPKAKFIAGGTYLLDLMKLQIERPIHLVDICALPLAAHRPNSKIDRDQFFNDSTGEGEYVYPGSQLRRCWPKRLIDGHRNRRAQPS